MKARSKLGAWGVFMVGTSTDTQVPTATVSNVNQAPAVIATGPSGITPDVTVLENGDYIITWNNNTNFARFQRFDSTGSAKTPILENASPANANFSYAPIINKLADGGYIISQFYDAGPKRGISYSI